MCGVPIPVRMTSCTHADRYRGAAEEVPYEMACRMLEVTISRIVSGDGMGTEGMSITPNYTFIDPNPMIAIITSQMRSL